VAPIIAFAYTTPALLAGAKTVTRRRWAERHARIFREGTRVDAWDRSPRIKIARRVATIRVLEEPRLERSDMVVLADWYLEGLEYLRAHGATDAEKALAERIWNGWVNHPHWLYVIRFELLTVLERPDRGGKR
jgi:hypothetical protein